MLTFDWADFYHNHEGETYFELLRQQFLATFDVVLIDSRTGITEMGGVCTYQLADVAVMFCGTSQQSLDGTAKMAMELKSSNLEKVRGRPLEVVVVPARVDVDSKARPEFREEFLKHFAQYTPTIFKRDSDYFWKLEIPYVTVCAYKEMIVPPRAADGSEDVYEAFARLTFALSRLAPDDSVIRRALPETKVSAAVVGNVVVDGGNFVGRDHYTIYHPLENTQVSLDTLRETYLHYLLATTGQLSLSRVDPKATSEREAQLSLSAVYTGLRTFTPEHRAQGNNRLSAVDQLNRHARLVLLGDPGSGKSTFVNFVTLCLAGEALGQETVNLSRLTEPLPLEEDERKDAEPLLQAWNHGALLPVRVVLRDFAARGLPPVGEWTSGASLWDFIVGELESTTAVEFAPYLKHHLLEHGGLLVLDGLDEVPETSQRREQIKQAVEDFAASFPQCRILLTSRTYAYQQQAWRLSGFAEAVLAPFGMAQIKRFVDRWYAHIAILRGLHPGDAAGRAELLKRAIYQSDRLCALAERPLLLTLMASLHAWRGGSLPEKREELYADMVALLLDRWESPKVVRDRDRVVVQQPSLAEWLRVDRNQVRALLERLAYTAHYSQLELVGTADIAEGELLSGLLHLSQNPDVNPARLVAYLSTRAGLLLPRGIGVYTFPHRTYQEYLAACYLTDRDYPDRVAELARQDPNRWREIALLTAAKAARGSDFAIWALVEALCYEEATDQLSVQDAWGTLLAGQILMENAALSNVAARNQPKLQRVRMNLVHLLAQSVLPAAERAVAGMIIAHLGDPRPGVGLQEDGLPDIAWCEVPAGPFTMGSNDADEQAEDYEKPQHQHDITYQYVISQYPVTVAQYEAFMQATGYMEQHYWTETGWKQKEHFRWEMPEQYGGPFNLPNHPVVGVSWYEASAYCRWVTETLRNSGKITEHQEIRWPDEAEWEKAARGQDNRAYPWGDTADPERANYGDTGIGTISAVGCFPSGTSPYGVEDMSGNMWEWTRSTYPHNVHTEREDNSEGGRICRIIRGGALIQIFRVYAVQHI